MNGQVLREPNEANKEFDEVHKAARIECIQQTTINNPTITIINQKDSQRCHQPKQDAATATTATTSVGENNSSHKLFRIRHSTSPVNKRAQAQQLAEGSCQNSQIKLGRFNDHLASNGGGRISLPIKTGGVNILKEIKRKAAAENSSMPRGGVAGQASEGNEHYSPVVPCGEQPKV